MNDDIAITPPQQSAPEDEPENSSLGMSSLYKLFEAFIALREKNERQHRMFEQSLNRSRDTLIEKFNGFAGETQRAFQNLRQELTGEKRMALAVLNELVDVSLELQHIVAVKPEPESGNAGWTKWAEAVEIQSRKVEAALQRHGIHPYDAVIGSAYRPELHERVGSKRMEGMDALRVAEQKEAGYASQISEFILRRPKVIVSE